MNTENTGAKKAKEILNIKGPAVASHVEADEQLLLWACSQAIAQVSSGNPIAATMILDAVVNALMPQGCELTEEEVLESDDPSWAVVYSPDYQKAKEHLSQQMMAVFFGMGGTTASIDRFVDF